MNQKKLLLILCLIVNLFLTSCSYNLLKPWALLVCDGTIDGGVRLFNFAKAVTAPLPTEARKLDEKK